MYQLLIVDDEIHAVRTIQSCIAWEKLSIRQIHVAFNIRQAKKIFSEHRIDMMICDIEMPQGSGLELLAWVKESYPESESVFLTCHSNFDYAKRAIKLGTLDYLLKPVQFTELELVVRKGLAKVNERKEQLESKAAIQHYSKLWAKHERVMQALEQVSKHCKADSDSPDVLNKIKHYIRQHMDQAISREDLAKHVNLHPDYLSRWFKKETGKSIIEYISTEKITFAKELLLTTDLSVSDIATTVGFSNFSYFSKVFKQEVKLNPNQYRKENRSELY